MALKFRRGTTAQQSGSLAFGEPYFNTDYNTLLVGSLAGDVVLASAGSSSAFVGAHVSASGYVSASTLKITNSSVFDGDVTFGSRITSKNWQKLEISASLVDIQNDLNVNGDLNINGNFTIGNQTTDTLSISASLASDIVPNVTNTYSLGSLDKYWKDLYISTGSIKMVSNGVVVSTLSNTGNGFSLDQGVTANGDSSFGTSSAAITSVTGSLKVSGSIAVIGSVSASTITGIGNVTSYSSSVNNRVKQLESDMFNVTASVQAINIWTSSVSTTTSVTNLSSSIYTRDANQDTNITANSASAAGAFASASAYSASAATVAITNANSAAGAFASASAYSASSATSFSASLASQTALSASIATTDSTQTTNITAASASAVRVFASASAYSASAASDLNSLSSSVASTDSTQTANITTASSSAAGAFASASAYSASAATSLNGLSSSVATTINNASSSAYSTFAKLNSDNVFTGTQTITGSLYVSSNLIVQGSSSLQNITASAASIGTNTVILNTATPSVRFGGVSVQDSGSGAGTSGSLLWDSQNDVWIYSQPSGAAEGYASARLISGPQNTGSLGGELGITKGQVPVAVGDDHIGDSIISASATKVTVAGDLSVTGNLSASINGFGNITAYSSSVNSRMVQLETDMFRVTSSVQAINIWTSSVSTTTSLNNLSASIYTTDATQTTNITAASASAAGAFASASAYSASAATVAITNANSAAGAFASASAYSASAATALNSFSASNATTDNTQTTNITAASASAAGAFASASAYSASAATALNTLSGSFNGVNIITGSIANNKLANSAITINGTSVSLGGTLTQAQTLAGAYSSSAQVDITATTGYSTFSSSFATNTVTFNGSAVRLGGSATITANTTNTLTIGTGLSGTSFNGSSAVTIANTGVTSNVAGTGISVSGATGAVTITNTGVTSAVAGTGVSVSGATGAVTFSIGQAVATTSAVTFASVNATGDIVAYYSSDRRYKNNIVTISDALSKVSKLNGVTWEWNDDVNEVTKKSPKTGLIAQEVQEVLPEVVTEREDGYLGLDYSKMVGLLVEAIKEQQQQIASLTIEVEKLKKNNSL